MDFDDIKLHCVDALGDFEGLDAEEIAELKEEYCEECQKDPESLKCTRGADLMGGMIDYALERSRE